MDSNVFTIERFGLFSRFDADEIVNRYRRTYHLGPKIGIDEVRKHAQLEAELTDELLATKSENRIEVFSRAYSKLFAELPWLVDTGTEKGAEIWATLFRKNSNIYEIGSGNGYLINYLSNNGFNCVRTDISTERLNTNISSIHTLTHSTTDGVNLSRYADKEAFDYVISNQVVEHLHPDDLAVHFSEANKLLKPGGEYVFATPYAPLGPADLSRVFGFDRPVFMHLHEMTYEEALRLALQAGFSDMSAIFVVPGGNIAFRSRAYTHYLLALDRYLSPGQSGVVKSTIKALRKPLMIRNNIFVSLKK